MVVIAVSGCVGTGKTTLAKKLALMLNLTYLNLSSLPSLHEHYDHKRRCWVIDVPKLKKMVTSIIKKEKNIIIDGHLSHYLNKRDVTLCLIVRCDLKVLHRRLKRRGYSSRKIKENLECEAFDICTLEAQEQGHRVLVVRGDAAFSLDTLAWIRSTCTV